MDSGPTDFDNLILLCGHHHRLLHHTEWSVEIGMIGKPGSIRRCRSIRIRFLLPGNSPPTAA
ncbi:HNH endonuclease signature motif containing protein [Rhodococcus sp. IEGM 1379]|nr:HNH endonuclease signature motif containing protein [Rhodococcus sp. IEGM 1379]MDI9917218.1 HNH endonuclease signature motif containing protein [Rhodococcus sp. IEGM 1379]